MTSPRAAVWGFGLTIVLASCSPITGPAPGFSLSPGTTPESGSGASGETNSSPGVVTTSADEQSIESRYVSAIDRARAAAEAAVGGQYGTEEFGLTMAELTDRAERVEELISACMAEAGFEYVPVDFTTIRRAMTSDKSAPGLTAAEYLRQYGHGLTTQPDKPIVEVGFGDQNRRILENLSAADQVAYRRTLYGENLDATHAFGLESEDFSRTGGCTRRAIKQAYEPHELLATYFNPADALIEQDPRAQAALEAWAGCMVDAGFSYRHPDDVDSDLQVRYDALLAGREPDELSEFDLGQLSLLQDEERAVAVASHGCEVWHLEPVLDRIEGEFYGRR